MTLHLSQLRHQPMPYHNQGLIMFVKMKTIASAAALAGVIAAGGAATAQAGTAVVTSGGNVSAAAPAARLVVNGTVPLNCVTSGSTSGATATSTVANGTYTGVAPLTVSSNLNIAFNNCTVAGIPFTVACTSGSPAATLRVLGNTVSGVTSGRIDMVNCVVSLPLIGCTANVAGQVDGTYANSGTLTVLTAGQSLAVSGSTCTSVIPNGSATFGAPVGTGTSLANLPYTLGSVKPQIAASGF